MESKRSDLINSMVEATEQSTRVGQINAQKRNIEMALEMDGNSLDITEEQEK